MTHTKGKVAVDSRETLMIRDDAGGLIAILTHLKGPCGLGGRRNDQEVEDNARRLAALWNAAEELGLTTEAIEKGVIQDSYHALADHLVGEIVSEKIHRLEAEKAEMLEALKAIKTELDADLFCPICEWVRGTHSKKCPGHLVNAAIRKARGEE